MKTIALSIALLSAASAHAVILTDTPESLVFDLTWTPPNMFGIDLQGGDHGSGGTDILVLGGLSANPYRYYIEVHQPNVSWWGFSLTFQGWNEFGASHPPDPVFGTITAPRIGYAEDHLLPVPGNDHAVRVVVGALPVPDGLGTFGALLITMGILAAFTLGTQWNKP